MSRIVQCDTEGVCTPFIHDINEDTPVPFSMFMDKYAETNYPIPDYHEYNTNVLRNYGADPEQFDSTYDPKQWNVKLRERYGPDNGGTDDPQTEGSFTGIIGEEAYDSLRPNGLIDLHKVADSEKERFRFIRFTAGNPPQTPEGGRTQQQIFRDIQKGNKMYQSNLAIFNRTLTNMNPSKVLQPKDYSLVEKAEHKLDGMGYSDVNYRHGINPRDSKIGKYDDSIDSDIIFNTSEDGKLSNGAVMKRIQDAVIDKYSPEFDDQMNKNYNSGFDENSLTNYRKDSHKVPSNEIISRKLYDEAVGDTDFAVSLDGTVRKIGKNVVTNRGQSYVVKYGEYDELTSIKNKVFLMSQIVKLKEKDKHKYDSDFNDISNENSIKNHMKRSNMKQYIQDSLIKEKYDFKDKEVSHTSAIKKNKSIDKSITTLDKSDKGDIDLTEPKYDGNKAKSLSDRNKKRLPVESDKAETQTFDEQKSGKTKKGDVNYIVNKLNLDRELFDHNVSMILKSVKENKDLSLIKKDIIVNTDRFNDSKITNSGKNKKKDIDHKVNSIADTSKENFKTFSYKNMKKNNLTNIDNSIVEYKNLNTKLTPIRKMQKNQSVLNNREYNNFDTRFKENLYADRGIKHVGKKKTDEFKVLETRMGEIMDEIDS